MIIILIVDVFINNNNKNNNNHRLEQRTFSSLKNNIELIFLYEKKTELKK